MFRILISLLLIAADFVIYYLLSSRGYTDAGYILFIIIAIIISYFEKASRDNFDQDWYK